MARDWKLTRPAALLNFFSDEPELTPAGRNYLMVATCVWLRDRGQRSSGNWKAGDKISISYSHPRSREFV